MPLSYAHTLGDGTTRNFDVPCEYLSRAHITVRVDGIDVPFTWIDTYRIQTATPPGPGTVVEVRRTTPRVDRLVTFSDGSTLVQTDLNTSTLQSFFLSQEAFDQGAASMGVTEDGHFTALQRRITGLLDPVNNQDAANKNYVDNGVASGVNTATTQAGLAITAAAGSKASEVAAKASETNAKGSENIAKDSIVATKASETAAKVSETNAKTAETNAKTAETEAKGAEARTKVSETAAKAAETEAKGAETRTKSSETAAKTAETGAKAAETAAKLTQQTLLNDISAGVTVLSGGASPTAAYNPADRKLTFGIPTPTFPVTTISNWNTVLQTGHYAASAGTPNAPTSNAYVGVYVAFDANAGALSVVDVMNGDGYDRHRISGTWGGWRKRLNKDGWQQVTNVIEILNAYLRINQGGAIWDFGVGGDGNLNLRRSGASGPSFGPDGNIHLGGIGWLHQSGGVFNGGRSRYSSGGSLNMSTGNHVDFHWNDGFYYRVDGNAWTMINRAASDRRLKDGRDFTADPLTELKALQPRRYEALTDTAIAMPKGERDGFYAQELERIDPALVEELPMPEATDGETIYTLASDASYQLIAKLTRAMQAQQGQIEALEIKLQELTTRVSALT